MPLLTASYSKALVELIHSGEHLVDAIEVGPWFTPKEITQFQQGLPEWTFHFHASSFISRVRLWPPAIKRLSDYLSCTQSMWVSVHIELFPVFVYLLSAYTGLHLPPPRPNRAKRQFLKGFERIKKSVGLPIILENLPSLPVKKYAFAANPELITDILDNTNCGLLLDIAHVRVAASHQEEDVYAYMMRLPFERVEQIHISGARWRNGYLRDAHEPLQDEDYRLLKWALRRCEPKVVTLEYFRESEQLGKQLQRLREIIPDQASIGA